MARIKINKWTVGAGVACAGLAAIGYNSLSGVSTTDKEAFARELTAQAGNVAHHNGQKQGMSIFHAKKDLYSSPLDARRETLSNADVTISGLHPRLTAAAGCLLLSANDISWPEAAVAQYLQAEANGTEDLVAAKAYEAAGAACLGAVEITPGEKRELIVLDGLAVYPSSAPAPTN
jgi:hypothetical protein